MARSTWTELMTPDPAAAAAFYEKVLGWTAQTVPMPTGEYTVFHVAGGNEQGIAGAMAPPMAGVPAYWGVYFCVDDAAATVARAESLGARCSCRRRRCRRGHPGCAHRSAGRGVLGDDTARRNRLSVRCTTLAAK